MILLSRPIRISLVPACATPPPTRPARHTAQRALRKIMVRFSRARSFCMSCSASVLRGRDGWQPFTRFWRQEFWSDWGERSTRRMGRAKRNPSPRSTSLRSRCGRDTTARNCITTAVMGFASLYPSYDLRAGRPFAERFAVTGNVVGPVLRIDSTLHHAMKRRMRPVAYPCHESMLDRVDMDIVDMPREIGLVANGVLPIASLPDPAFAPAGTAGGNVLALQEAAWKRD